MENYKGKIFAAIGAGGQYQLSDPEYSSFGPKNAFLAFIGPSGNVARAPKPQELNGNGVLYGNIIRTSVSGWSGMNSLGTNCCTWGANEFVFFYDGDRGTIIDGAGMTCAFQPYGTDGVREIPWARDVDIWNSPRMYAHTDIGASPRPTAANAIRARVQDDTYYKQIARDDRYSYYKNGSLITICDRCHHIHLNVNAYALYLRTYKFGKLQKYWSQEELAKSHPSFHSGSGYISITDGFAHDGNYGGYTGYGGTFTWHWRIDATSSPTGPAANIQGQSLFFQGRLYMIKETSILAGIPALPCSYGLTPIVREGVKDYMLSDVYTGSRYVTLSPITSEYSPFSEGYRCPIAWGNRLLLLQNDGKLYELSDGSMRLLTDIKETLADSEWVSGVWGGSFGFGHNNAAYKCYGIKLGNTLHVFLNYRKGLDIGGVCWLTSTDLENFLDKTQYLPQSGIVPPSGWARSDYLNYISPYRFSGYENFRAVDGNGQPLGATRCEPSGWTQTSGLYHEWYGSGTFVECDYTKSPDQWDIPMHHTARTHHLFPTSVTEPIRFGTPNGLAPSGTRYQGYRWNGVTNYHVHGVKDQDAGFEKVHLFFTQDVVNNPEGQANLTDQNPPRQCLYYTLNEHEDWIFKNEFAMKRISWVEPTDMLEPSILLASGGPHKPYPYEDRINKVVYQPYTIYDWPIFGKVTVQVQYSTDWGGTWHNATRHATLSSGLSNLDTGSLAVDPSGTIGKEYVFAWDYEKDIGDNRFDWVQFRIRAIGY